ncbi:MAG TPA: hypothetical protein VE526_14640 [Solirubrobacteraceae bacterium]|nr:hypothetical protein [Solirubrobacteraceae bacterium]
MAVILARARLTARRRADRRAGRDRARRVERRGGAHGLPGRHGRGGHAAPAERVRQLGRGQRGLRATAEREAHAGDARGDDRAEQVPARARRDQCVRMLRPAVARAAEAPPVGHADARERHEPVGRVGRRREQRLGVHVDAVARLAEHGRLVLEADVAGRPGVDAEQRPVCRVEADEDRVRRRRDEHEARRESARRDGRATLPPPPPVLGLRRAHRRRDRGRVRAEARVRQDPEGPLRGAWDPPASRSLVATVTPQDHAQPAVVLPRAQLEAVHPRNRAGRLRRAHGTEQRQHDDKEPAPHPSALPTRNRRWMMDSV